MKILDDLHEKVEDEWRMAVWRDMFGLRVEILE